MKIILEFQSEQELNAYIQIKAKDFIDQNSPQEEDGSKILEEQYNGGEALSVSETDTKIETHTRRRHWSDMEIQFLKDYYLYKSVRWIAKSLRRKNTDVHAKLAQMYKKGLPRKKAKNGRIREE